MVTLLNIVLLLATVARCGGLELVRQAVGFGFHRTLVTRVQGEVLHDGCERFAVVETVSAEIYLDIDELAGLGILALKLDSDERYIDVERPAAASTSHWMGIFGSSVM